jgi:hypothetical protein
VTRFFWDICATIRGAGRCSEEAMSGTQLIAIGMVIADGVIGG